MGAGNSVEGSSVIESTSIIKQTHHHCHTRGSHIHVYQATEVLRDGQYIYQEKSQVVRLTEIPARAPVKKKQVKIYFNRKDLSGPLAVTVDNVCKFG